MPFNGTDFKVSRYKFKLKNRDNKQTEKKKKKRRNDNGEDAFTSAAHSEIDLTQYELCIHGQMTKWLKIRLRLYESPIQTFMWEKFGHV